MYEIYGMYEMSERAGTHMVSALSFHIDLGFRASPSSLVVFFETDFHSKDNFLSIIGHIMTVICIYAYYSLHY
jgi:hypothetical protein